VHTAVKIAPNYSGPVVYVPDASRSVGVAQGLLGDGKAVWVAELNADYDKVRDLHAGKKQTPLWPLAKARANATPIDWRGYAPKVPKFIGRRVFKNFDLAELANYIDWGPFFQTWDLAGPYPAILQDEVVGEQARKVFADAKAMLQKSSMAAGSRPMRWWACSRPTASATTSRSMPMKPAASRP